MRVESPAVERLISSIDLERTYSVAASWVRAKANSGFFASHNKYLEPNVIAGSYALRKSVHNKNHHEATANGDPKTRNKTDANFLCFVARQSVL